MTRRFSPLRQPVRVRRAGFTLIELLTVIAIILVLAGLLLHVAGNANYKSSMARAKAEIKAIETALESYKADNGAYPRILPSSQTQTANGPTGGTSSSDQLNAQSDTDPGGTAKTKYQAASETLYQALNGITAFNGTTPTYGGRRYMEFKSGQLLDSAGTAFVSPAASTMIVDPFGLPYGYSTANIYAVEQSATTTTAGYNPTFDLWSTGGYSPASAKAYPTGTTGTACAPLWATNW